MPEVVTRALSAVEPKQSDASYRRILIVDDNDDLRIYLVNTLGEDYLVQSCHNGKEALETVSYTHLDVYKRQTYGCALQSYAISGVFYS